MDYTVIKDVGTVLFTIGAAFMTVKITMKHLDERLTKLETKEEESSERLVRIETKLDLLLSGKIKDL